MVMPMRLSTAVLLTSSVVLSLLATGCSSSFDPLEGTTAPVTDVGTITGLAHGGRQPIAGAHVYLLQASIGGYGGRGIVASSGNKSTSLLKAFSTGQYPTNIDGNGNYYVTTDAKGTFSISGEYNLCTVGYPVYLYSVGGDTGGGNNSAAGLMAALGTCPAGGSLASAYPSVNMNEVSTIATAYALAGFATDALHVGSSGTALAQVGIANAIGNANQLFDVKSSPYNGTVYATSARSTTPNSGTNGGTGTVPQQQINTLANILAACLNTTGPSSAQCTTLFGLKSLGASGNTATDTATEAIYMAQNPTVTSVYSITGTVGFNPFTPWFTSGAPPDFTIDVYFTGGGYSGSGAGIEPRELAIDASGNLWAVSGLGTNISEFSSLGVPTSSTGFSSTNVALAPPLDQPQAIAIDNGGASAQVYVANFADVKGTVTRFLASTGAVVNSYQINPSGTNSTEPGPIDLAIDGSGNIWTADYTDGKFSMHGGTGTGAATEYTNANFVSPICVAVATGAAGSVYLGDYEAAPFFKFNNPTPGAGTTYADASNQGSSGNAVDASGNIWFTAFSTANAGMVSKLPAGGGTPTNYTSNLGYNPNGIAMDGASNAWVTEEGNGTGTGTIYEMKNSDGSFLSPTGGFVPIPAGAPTSIAVDGSGDVWYNMNTDGKIHELIGVAVPVATPLAYGAVSNLLGQEP
jgi:sugar lactone lactonase YvrE